MRPQNSRARWRQMKLMLAGNRVTKGRASEDVEQTRRRWLALWNVAGFDFRWNTRKLDDEEPTILAIQKAKGKRLMYHKPIAA